MVRCRVPEIGTTKRAKCKRPTLNMQGIFDLVYMLAVLSYLLLSIFIIYHLVRYSVSKPVMAFTVGFFIIGTTLLLFANMVLFFSMPLDQFAPTSVISPESYPSNSPFSVPTFPKTPFSK